MMAFFLRFSFEVKEFHVSINGRGVIKLLELRGKSFSSIFLGRYEALWIVNLVEKLLTVAGNQAIALKFNEASRAFLAQRYSNKAGRYVAIAQYGEGRRRGVVMIPKGKERARWKELVGIFQEVVEQFGKAR